MVKNFFYRHATGKLLLVKCSQAWSNWMKKSSLFCFCKFLWLVDLRICFCLKRARPWSEFRITFNQYSMKSFQRTLVGFNNNGNSRQNKSSPLETPQNYVKPLRNFKTLITPGNSTLFLITPRKSTSYFFNTSGNSISSTPPPLPPLFLFFFFLE